MAYSTRNTFPPVHTVNVFIAMVYGDILLKYLLVVTI